MLIYGDPQFPKVSLKNLQRGNCKCAKLFETSSVEKAGVKPSVSCFSNQGVRTWLFLRCLLLAAKPALVCCSEEYWRTDAVPSNTGQLSSWRISPEDQRYLVHPWLRPFPSPTHTALPIRASGSHALLHTPTLLWFLRECPRTGQTHRTGPASEQRTNWGLSGPSLRAERSQTLLPAGSLLHLFPGVV